MSEKTNMDYLRFQKGNSKLDKHTGIFSLPAGHSCPGAKACMAKAVINEEGKRKVVDGKGAEFRCFAATAEVQYEHVYNKRQANFELIRSHRTAQQKADLLLASLEQAKLGKITKFRVHDSGDFFGYSYFEAWMKVAESMPEVTFYAYTKSLPFLVKGMKNNIIPDNFKFTASYGGKFDHMIEEYDLKNAKVVLSEEEAADQGLPIDHDDSHASDDKGNFALLIHGTQPKGSHAAKQYWKLLQAGKSGYSRKTKKNRKAA
jgi:hypothetical protein